MSDSALLDSFVQQYSSLKTEIGKVIVGQDKAVDSLLLSIFTGGHCLLVGVPGLAKTLMVNTLSRALGLTFSRIQFTPDLMPSDITGSEILDENRHFQFIKGPVFANIVLADEINRTSPKTQSALLEVMEERKVSVEGVTREVPVPFLVIATQNPSGTAGTQRLPEAQIDRFMINLSLGYPDYNSELEIAKTVGIGSRTDNVKPIITKEEFLEMQKEIHDVYVKDIVYDYLLKLVVSTRTHQYVERGASPRATIALVKCAKAFAWLNCRHYVIPSDIITQMPYIMTHRISLNTAARMSNITKKQVIEEIARTTPAPYMGAVK